MFQTASRYLRNSQCLLAIPMSGSDGFGTFERPAPLLRKLRRLMGEPERYTAAVSTLRQNGGLKFIFVTR